MPAVEVDMPGCSFNPEYESHQDALAVAVAHEYKQELKQELMPKAPSQHAPEGYRPVDELDELLVDAEQSEDEDEQAAVGGKRQHKKLAIAAADDNEIVLDDEADAGGCAATAALQASARAVEDACPASAEFGTTAPAAAAAARKTKKDRNREARRKHQDMEIAAKQALKQQRQQLEALQELQQQLAQEHEEKAALRLRKQVRHSCCICRTSH
jgi:nucleolar protein 53